MDKEKNLSIFFKTAYTGQEIEEKEITDTDIDLVNASPDDYDDEGNEIDEDEYDDDTAYLSDDRFHQFEILQTNLRNTFTNSEPHLRNISDTDLDQVLEFLRKIERDINDMYGVSENYHEF